MPTCTDLGAGHIRFSHDLPEDVRSTKEVFLNRYRGSDGARDNPWVLYAHPHGEICAAARQSYTEDLCFKCSKGNENVGAGSCREKQWVSLAATKGHDRSTLRRLPLVPKPPNDVGKISQGLLDREVGDLVLIKRVWPEWPAPIFP